MAAAPWTCQAKGTGKFCRRGGGHTFRGAPCARSSNRLPSKMCTPMSARTTRPIEIHDTADSAGIIPPVGVWRLMNATYANSAMNPAQAPKAPSPASFAIFGGIVVLSGGAVNSKVLHASPAAQLLERSNDGATVVVCRRDRFRDSQIRSADVGVVE